MQCRARTLPHSPPPPAISADVEDFLAEQPSVAEAQPPAAAAGVGAETRGFRDVPVSGMRRVIADRLTQSKQEVPHYYLTVDVELDELLGVRERLNADLQGTGAKLSVNDFLIKASALAMRDVRALPRAAAEPMRGESVADWTLCRRCRRRTRAGWATWCASTTSLT